MQSSQRYFSVFQIHVSIALSSEKEPLEVIGYEAGWAPPADLDVMAKMKIISPTGNVSQVSYSMAILHSGQPSRLLTHSERPDYCYVSDRLLFNTVGVPLYTTVLWYIYIESQTRKVYVYCTVAEFYKIIGSSDSRPLSMESKKNRASGRSILLGRVHCSARGRVELKAEVRARIWLLLRFGLQKQYEYCI